MEKTTDTRNYSTISPSAKSLLLMKGHTSIPFARKAAALVMYPDKYIPDFDNTDFGFWARTAHFENRYWSIDQLLEGLRVQNILELSSGFSLRGLDAVMQKDVHYIDTDLAEIMDQKAAFIASLRNGKLQEKGILETLPLNALDEEQFKEIVNHFPAGELAIINEGLLIYLDNAEKERLCAIIHKILKERGGYWITADIYVKNRHINSHLLKIDDKMEQFFKQHRIEENKFDSFEEAEAFFRKAGFVIDMEAEPDYSKVGSLSYMLKNTTPEQLEGLKKAGRNQSTWRLKVDNG